MDRPLSESQKEMLRSAVKNSYVEAYDEAVDMYFERDLHAWRMLLGFRERFQLRAWEYPQPDATAKVDGQR